MRTEEKKKNRDTSSESVVEGLHLSQTIHFKFLGAEKTVPNLLTTQPTVLLPHVALHNSLEQRL